MKVLTVWCIAACMAFAACAEKKDAKGKDSQEEARLSLGELKDNVRAIEDSLRSGKLKMDPNGKTCVYYAESCLKVYEKYPNSDDAPVYLDRAHMIFASCNLHQRSVVAGEELLKKYEDYEGRRLVLSSVAAAYDLFILPRDISKVKYYYEMLLKENPDLPAEEKETYEFRLKYIDLTYDELIELQQAKKQNS